ncbi:MAG: hypothetical protein QF492_09250, partial [Candidatus Krumholzibacteria bacterium]|nr:hypothetical protein [Candidatus Krumholzibacteria bacterium]
TIKIYPKTNNLRTQKATRFSFSLRECEESGFISIPEKVERQAIKENGECQDWGWRPEEVTVILPADKTPNQGRSK